MNATQTILAILAQGSSFSYAELQEKSGLPLQKVKSAMTVLRRGRCLAMEPVRFRATAAGTQRHEADVLKALNAKETRAEKLAEKSRNRKSPGRKPLPADVREARYRERVRRQIEKRAQARQEARLAKGRSRVATQAERDRIAEAAKESVQQASASRTAIEQAWCSFARASEGEDLNAG
ncbi:hypothetical protein ABL850_14810 [Variovorax paradoxus]|uniref:hypothetical protein n=1 Tax=Variovorax paradoxus TaxID=34073 RepID=UPI00041780F3